MIITTKQSKFKLKSFLRLEHHRTWSEHADVQLQHGHVGKNRTVIKKMTQSKYGNIKITRQGRLRSEKKQEFVVLSKTKRKKKQTFTDLHLPKRSIMLYLT